MLLATFIRFSKFLIEAYIIPNVDFQLYFNWATHNVKPPVWGTFMYPFIPIPYTPFWSIIMFPFAHLSYENAKHLWYVFNLILFLGFIYLSYRWVKDSKVFSDKKYLEIVIPLVLFLNYIPLIKTLRTGQANILALFFVALSFAFYQKKKEFLSGLFLAVAILSKLTPAILVLYWILKKEYRLVKYTFLSLILLWVIAIPFGGIQLQLDYFHWLVTYPFHFFKDPQADNSNNVSLYALQWDILHLFKLPYLVAVILYAFTIVGLLSFWYYLITVRGKNSSPSSLLEYGWTLALIPILTQYSEDHHFVYLCLLYVGIWSYLNMKLPMWIWSTLAISWILINCTYFLFDMHLLPEIRFIDFYLTLYGVLLAVIASGVLLYILKTGNGVRNE